MSPPRSRGQILVNLANANTKDVYENTQLVNSNKSQDIPVPDVDQDLQYSMELQNFKCSGLTLPDNITIDNISPILEYIDHSEMLVVTEPNDVEIIPLNSLDTINSLFPYTDENKLNDEPNNDQQTETVTDFNEDNGSTASDVDKNQPIEISTNGNDENSSN